MSVIPALRGTCRKIRSSKPASSTYGSKASLVGDLGEAKPGIGLGDTSLKETLRFFRPRYAVVEP